MENPSKVIRRAIHTYLKNYQYFTSTTALIILPVSVSILLSEAITPSTSLLFPTVYSRFRSIFYAAGFPESSKFFSTLSIKLSQTICCTIFTLPFTLSFLLVAKSSIIKALHHENPSLRPSFFSFLPLSYPLLTTHLCNSFIILAANASALTLLFLTFNLFDAFGFSSPNFLLLFSATGAVLYSVILANTIVACNLALVVSGMENCSGFLAILKACFMIRGRSLDALLLALPFNLALAAIEALFHYRVVRLVLLLGNFSSAMAFEGLVIAYLYSILLVLDTITTCEFFKSCKSKSLLDSQDKHYYLIQIEVVPEKDNGSLKSSTNLDEHHELP